MGNTNHEKNSKITIKRLRPSGSSLGNISSKLEPDHLGNDGLKSGS